MNSKTPMFGAFLCICLFDLLIIIFSIIVIVINTTQIENASIDLNLVEQLKEDWGRVPYTDYIVRTNSEPCQAQAGEEPAFTWTYQGTVEGCQFRDKVITYQEYSARYRQSKGRRKPQCWPIDEIDPVTVTSIQGTTICGVKGGFEFYKVQRPDFLTQKCPNGTEPCSAETSLQNTVCYPPSEHENSCPITATLFFKQNSDELQSFESQNATSGLWTKKDSYPGYVMFYSTKAVDSLPLGKTDLTYRPCMNPTQKETNPANLFYTLEVQQREMCNVEYNTGLKYDPRYFYTGYQVDDLSLMRETGIWNELLNLPFYQQEVRNPMGIKQDVVKNLYGRPTIAYDLKCEQNQTREDFYVELTSNPDEDLSAMAWITTFTSLVLAFTAFFCLASICVAPLPGKEGLNIMIAYVLLKGAIQMGTGIGLLLNVLKLDQTIANSQHRLDAAALINGCSDEYTHIDVQHYTDELIQINQALGSQPVLVVITFVFICLSVIFLILAGVAKRLALYDF